MTDRILVAYATRYGSTREVAEAVASRLREAGVAVDLQAMSKVKDLASYGVVMLGAPIYISALHKDAQHFLLQHREALVQRPVAIFALGPNRDDAEQLQGSRAQLDAYLAKYPWLVPFAVGLFVGKYDPAKLRFPDSLIAVLPASPLHNEPARDERDWTAIRTWADEIARQLQAGTLKQGAVR